VRWGPGGAGRAVKGQLAAGKMPAMGGGRLQRNREGEAGGRRRGPAHKFAKVQGVYCKVKFASKL
jgi:hypothetical protein